MNHWNMQTRTSNNEGKRVSVVTNSSTPKYIVHNSLFKKKNNKKKSPNIPKLD